MSFISNSMKKRNFLDTFFQDADDDVIEALTELDLVFNELTQESQDRVFNNFKQTLISNFNFTMEQLDELWIIANTCDGCGLKFKCNCSLRC